ncbi:ABC transporter ATP-binding protein [Anaerosacchariphilus polymeriproducens]|uniref:ATP-binding cassette domain-containing protein n=1 Tax=Anaerosacchariphilus polymeriproducens TaxID=1812858 RepID=A0A371ARV2_9FIRM|nr:ATP-binding cassette domain-containing protein [Anaerosacchariphilus polymeriproducens]RDU22287.1 ATP-binding cassette domain-containing protein [Anaerosacchariphilus polymeriproducens]
MREKIVVKAMNLTKKYKQVVALNQVDITVKKGDIYGLVGNNGAGKTTFLKMLTGQIQPTDGQLNLLDAQSETEMNHVRRKIGAIIETPSFYPNLSIEKNLEYYRIQRGIPGKKAVTKALEEVGLLEVKKRKYSALSLGMKQRLGLALALMGEPEVLILDEPINGLDPSGIIEIRNLLLKLNREKYITILISSHILMELENVASHYGFLDKGKIKEEISAEKLKEKCTNYLELKVTDAEKYAALLELKLNCKDYKVLSGNCIQIMNVKDREENLSDYSALAIKNDIGLLSMDMRKIDLENYYMNLISGIREER